MADCDRACLQGHLNTFIDAVLRHDPAALPLAPQAKAIHNGKPSRLDADELWKGVETITYRQSVVDPVSGQAALFAVATENHERGTLFVRLKVEHGKLTEIETITGERIVDGVPGLISPNPFFNYVLPPRERRTREQLIAIADSYFEGLERHDGSHVPVSEDCRRFEDGVQTSLNPVFLPLACNDFAPFKYMDKTANRLYPIVDVERGLVLGQMVIQVSQAAGPPTAPLVTAAGAAPHQVNPATGMVMPANEFRHKPHDTIIHELFKVVDGKITEIQTIRLDRPYGWGGGW
ncbi:MAG TPA: hypothetical protein VHB68_03160 [Steroidobacteraceae bacterium]|nr:hypothetical protein [Steroidobacteraceae bacterium]